MDIEESKPLQRVTRTRTGCFTCRKRRIKCDEQKPICFRCEKSYRKCAFPQSPVFTDKVALLESPGGLTTVEPLVVCQDFAPPPMVSDAKSDDRLSEDGSDQGQVVKFRPTSPHSHGNVSSETLSFEIKSEIRTLSPSSDGTSLSPFEQASWLDATSISSPDGLCLRTVSPLSTARFISRFPGQPVPLSSPDYLQFHRERIIAAHYFWHYDYHEFCTKTILKLAENSVTLHHAVVAFSALIYSVKFYYPPARDYALAYYHWALKSFQILLPEIAMGGQEQYTTALATALQLASFDRFLTDSVKCFRHLKGAAQIMQRCSDPVTQSSTPLGRSLLQWYLHLEDHCTLALTCKPQLSSEWRQADLRVRRKLAEQDYPRLSKEERSARLLDDLWPELWALGPYLAEVFSKIPRLKSLQELERLILLDQLRERLTEFQSELEKLIRSQLVQEILELSESKSNPTFDPWHSECCPAFPTESAGSIYIFRFAPAGHFKITLLVLRLYMRLMLYAPLLEAGLPFLPNQGSEVDYNNEEFDAAEMCRTYAGIEASFGDNMDLMLPSLYSLVMAGFSCPRYLRRWLWCKLAHLEPLGRNYIEPIKEGLAIVWDRPELKAEGIGFGKERPEAVGKAVRFDDIDLVSKMHRLSLEQELTQG